MMLILTREIYQSVDVQHENGDVMRIHLVKTDRGKIRLGFEAGRQWKIVRTELKGTVEPIVSAVGMDPRKHKIAKPTEATTKE